MKRFLLAIVLSAFPCLGACGGQTYNIGSGQTYTTWIAAFTQFLTDCPQGSTLSSGITFHVVSGTYTATNGGNHTIFPLSPQFVVCCAYHQIGTSAANRIFITLDPGVVVDGTGINSIGLYTDQTHLTVTGGEFKAQNSYAMQFDTGANDIAVSGFYLHDQTAGGNGILSVATNLSVSNGTITNVYGYAISSQGNNCSIHHITASVNQSFQDGFYVAGNACNVHDNVVHDFQRAAINFDSANVTGGSAYNNFLYNSSFELEANTGATGLTFYNNISGGNTLINTYNIDNGACADLYNNIAWGTVGNGESSAMYGVSCPASIVPHVYNNVAYVASGANGLVTGGASYSTPLSDYNDFYTLPGGNYAHVAGAAVYTLAQWQAFTGGDAHSINADPQFYNVNGLTPASYAFLPSSPLKDAGTPVALFPADFFGTPRPQFNAWDIGPYEFRKSVAIVAQ